MPEGSQGAHAEAMVIARFRNGFVLGEAGWCAVRRIKGCGLELTWQYKEDSSLAFFSFCYRKWMPGRTICARCSVPIAGTEQIADLLAMAPHLYRATAEGRVRATALTEISLTVDIVDVQLTRLGRAAGK